MTPEFRLRGIHYRYGHEVALDDISFEIPEGKITGVVGDNGAGKSTLLSLLSRQRRWQGGSATAPGGAPWSTLRLSWLASDEICLPGFSPRHFARRYLGPALGLTPEGSQQRFDMLCERLAVLELADRHPRRLSRGQRLRLGLAIALLESPDLALLDEPFLGLDPSATDRALACLVEERSAGESTLLVSDHRLEILEEICDRWVFLVRGRVARVVDAGEGGKGVSPVSLREVYREVSSQ